MSGDILAIYEKDWDDEVGLWRQEGHGHTGEVKDCAAVHSYRHAAGLLASAGLDGVLDKIQTERVLLHLRDAQVKDGDWRGSFRFYHEETSVADTNGPFFISLYLLIVYHEFREQLTPREQALLRTLLEEVRFWFSLCAAKVKQSMLSLPNQRLGDAVCGWLVAEIADDTPPDLEAAMGWLARYYLENAWGVGEHLSNQYAPVGQNELVLLLMYQTRLPAAIRDDYETLLSDLMAVDEAFRGGPRVPGMRTPFYEAPPIPDTANPPLCMRPFIDGVAPWQPGQGGSDREALVIRSVAHKRGMLEQLRTLAKAGPTYATEVPDPGVLGGKGKNGRCVRIPYCGGQEARAWVTPDLRMGVMSTYPVLRDIDYVSWGTAWQVMPALFWHSHGDWAFLQWETEEDGRVRAHPAHTRFHWNCYALSDVMDPVPQGETMGVQDRHAFAILRRMPRLSPLWPEVRDRFRIIGCTAELVGPSQQGDWHRLDLLFGDSGLVLWFHPLGDAVTMSLEENGRSGYDWTAHYVLDGAARPGGVAGIWCWQATRRTVATPSLTQQDDGYRVVLHEDDRDIALALGDYSPNASQPGNASSASR